MYAIEINVKLLFPLKRVCRQRRFRVGGVDPGEQEEFKQHRHRGRLCQREEGGQLIS